MMAQKMMLAGYMVSVDSTSLAMKVGNNMENIDVIMHEINEHLKASHNKEMYDPVENYVKGYRLIAAGWAPGECHILAYAKLR